MRSTDGALTPQLTHALFRMWRHVMLKLPPDARCNTFTGSCPRTASYIPWPERGTVSLPHLQALASSFLQASVQVVPIRASPRHPDSHPVVHETVVARPGSQDNPSSLCVSTAVRALLTAYVNRQCPLKRIHTPRGQKSNSI